ncbi:MAG TPA: 2-amino-4-hydroxy-6-hydroxymethyldihydropteridine diphosphokinase [Planctomycetota bacterium]|nr:2-amino-4-hydroxy-6-hydroxymethyldihydropteridine diphosphokinase [Planctomycetota bacterium]
MSAYAIGVGSNLGDRAAQHDRAAQLLAADGMVALRARSRLHETSAIGGPAGQPSYLNAAWVVATDLGPHQLLHRLQAIETALGRVRTVVDGPRPIDLDLLLREDGLIATTAVLALPHPRLHLRAFVLAPLAEVAGPWRHPRLGLTIAELRARL